MIGVFGFIFSFKLWEELRKSGDMGKVNITEWLGINEGIFIFIFIVVAIVTFIGFQKWQDKWKDKLTQEEIDDLGL